MVFPCNLTLTVSIFIHERIRCQIDRVHVESTEYNVPGGSDLYLQLELDYFVCIRSLHQLNIQHEVNKLLLIYLSGGCVLLDVRDKV